MRFVKLQVALLLLAVVVVAALGADVVLKNRAENALVAQVMAKEPDTSGVGAKIRSFPFVGRLVVSGQVARVDVTAQHATVGGVALSDIRVQAEGVKLDTAEAAHGRAVVRSIKGGSVQADLRQDQINSRLPKQIQVQVQQGTATITGPGGAQAQLLVTPDGTIQLRIANRSVLDLAIPKTALLPCVPKGTFVTGAVHLSCTFSEVPPILLNLARP